MRILLILALQIVVGIGMTLVYGLQGLIGFIPGVMLGAWLGIRVGMDFVDAIREVWGSKEWDTKNGG